MPMLPMSRVLVWLLVGSLFAACSSDGIQGRPQGQEPDPPPGDPGDPPDPPDPPDDEPGDEPDDPADDFPDPWPKDEVRYYGPENGLPARIIGVGFDDAKNVYAIDGGAAYALRVGTDTFVRTASGGQFERGWPVASIAGGPPGQVYLGFRAPEGGSIFDYTEEDKMYGDVDRMNLEDDGTLTLDHHYKIQNTNAIWIDETRSILTMTRIVGGPYHGDVYLGSNHGVTVLRGDHWADHRHTIFLDENGSMMIGYVYTVNYDSQANFLFGGYWKIGATPPAPLDDLESWVSYVEVPWLIDTWPEHLGHPHDPKEIHAIAGEIDEEIIYIGTWGTGMHAMEFSPRRWWRVDGTPDTHINNLQHEPDKERMWVATQSRGLWTWDTRTGAWEQNPHVPADADVIHMVMDRTVEPRMLYAATNRGLYILRVP